jgi:hypothetical protein
MTLHIGSLQSHILVLYELHYLSRVIGKFFSIGFGAPQMFNEMLS